jgi:transcriptional regulator with XRE-family HTH domain
MSFHDRLRAARKDAGLSVNAFAKKLGVSSTAAWNWDWENTTPKPDKLPRIAEILGVEVDYLTGSDNKHVPALSTPAKGETVEDILRDSSRRIAALLKTNPSRIAVTFTLQ